MTNHLLARLLCAASLCVLAACGGGGSQVLPAAPTLSLSATPSSVQTGQSITLTWIASNADTCTASGSWSGHVATSGSLTGILPSPGEYNFILTCSGPGGSVTQATQAVASGASSSNTISVALAAAPTSVPVGQSTTLTWTAADATSCTASGDWTGSKVPTGSETVTASRVGVNTYILNCSGPSGSGTQQTYVTGTVPAISLSSDQDVAKAGGTATLSWSTTNASSCVASDGWSGTKATSGSQAVTIPGIASYNFTLSCSDGTNSTSKTVSVKGSVPAVSMSVFPENVVAGKTVTLRWQTQYADACTASGDWNGTLETGGYRTLTMSAEGAKSFHLSCSNPGGSTPADASATVVAKPASPPATTYRMSESHDGIMTTTNGVTYPPNSAPTWTRDFGVPVSYPLIAGGKIFVTTANANQAYGNQLYALNPATGATIWGPVSVPGTYFGSGLTYDNGRVFVLMFDGGLRAFNASNGAALWTTQLPGYWYEGFPNAYGGIVFTVGNGGLSAVDEKTGAILWTATGGTTEFVSPAVSSEAVYFMDSYYCNAFAYEPLSGKKIWQQTGAQCNYAFGYTPVIKGGVLYGRTAGAANLFDAATGTPDGQLATGVGPSITDTAFVTLNSATLSSTSLSDHVQTWTFTGDGTLSTAPVMVNNIVFVGSTSGKVYGVDAATGLQVWMGTAPRGINADNENGGPQPPAGPAAGENLLLFPSSSSLIAWKLQ